MEDIYHDISTHEWEQEMYNRGYTADEVQHMEEEAAESIYYMVGASGPAKPEECEEEL